jgi:hypothetical protein
MTVKEFLSNIFNRLVENSNLRINTSNTNEILKEKKGIRLILSLNTGGEDTPNPHDLLKVFDIISKKLPNSIFWGNEGSIQFTHLISKNDDLGDMSGLIIEDGYFCLDVFKYKYLGIDIYPSEVSEVNVKNTMSELYPGCTTITIKEATNYQVFLDAAKYLEALPTISKYPTTRKIIDVLNKTLSIEELIPTVKDNPPTLENMLGIFSENELQIILSKSGIQIEQEEISDLLYSEHHTEALNLIERKSGGNYDRFKRLLEGRYYVVLRHKFLYNFFDECAWELGYHLMGGLIRFIKFDKSVVCLHIAEDILSEAIISPLFKNCKNGYDFIHLLYEMNMDITHLPESKLVEALDSQIDWYKRKGFIN